MRTIFAVRLICRRTLYFLGGKEMKNTMKKILCSLLVVVLCLTSAPLSGFVGLELPEWNWKASAEVYSGECGAEGDNLIWTIDSSNYVLKISGKGEMASYNSFSSVPWYSYCSYIKAIELPQNLTSISNYAFANFRNLTSITIPNGVFSIGAFAFYSCESMVNLTLPDSITSIGDDAFENCTKLSEIIIPDSVFSIGANAFNDCSNLENIILADSVKSIGALAFYDTKYYKSNSNWQSDVLYIGNHLIKANPNIPDSYQIKKGTKSIADEAFNGRSNLSAITVPNGVTAIGQSAFDSCTKLESITLPDSVTSIGNAAFYNTAYYRNNKNWQNEALYINNHIIKLKSSVSSIYEIIDGTKSIADNAFGSCKLTGVIIPDSVKSIGNEAFYYCTNLKNVTMPNSVESIGEWAFYNCTSLEKVILSDCITTIGKSAFMDCTKLENLTIPNGGVTSIEGWSFYNCTSLGSVTIPCNITKIEKSAFYNCKSLTDVYYEGSETEWKKIAIAQYNNSILNATIHYNCVMPDSGSDDNPTFTEEDFKFRKAEYTEKIDYSNESPSIEITEAILFEYNTEFFDSKGYTSDDIEFTVADTDIISFNRAVLNYWSTEKVGLACLVTPLKSGTTKLTAALPDGTSASCKIISVVIEKEEDDDEEPEKDLINTNSENEAFIQQHLIFRKAYYDYFTKNLRWASEIWNHMDTAATLAAELAYDIIEGALEIVSLKFLDGLEVAANPYDVILLDFLASNISQSHFAKNAKEDALTVAVDIVNKAIKIFSDDSKWDPDFDIKNEVKLLITSSDYSQNNLYLALDNLHDGDYSDKITKIFNGFDCFGQVMKAVTAGAKFADMFVELLRYTVAIEGFYNSTAVFKSVLDEIATEMEVNNPVFASYFENALEFYEDSLTYDSIVEYVIKNKGIGDTAKLIYDMSTNVISDATVSFIMKAFKVGKDVARKVNAALWSAEVGWGLSNLLTGNNVSIGCRRMLRATYALDVATYNVMERFRTILDRDESYGAALCFDSSFNIFKMTQLYSLEQYKKYCENMATRPFTFNKSEFKNEDEFITAATVTWKDINCHYVGGSSSFRTSRVDTLRVACPTDVYVYRKADNKLVASVINNKSKLYDDSVAILCIDGEKSFAATDMDDYRIEIKATDNGTMDVIYNSYSDFKNTKKLSFDDVPIKSGNKYELDDEKESIKRDDNVEYKTDGRVDNCSCNCHKGGISGFFFKLILFFQKIFKTNKTCSCGVAHY